MRRLWFAFMAVMVVSFAVLSWIGVRICQEKPPILNSVVTSAGQTLIEPGEIGAGQNVWQALGGMQVGSVWGHGSYVAPDWTADWLHREAIFLLERWSNDDFNKPFEALDEEQSAQLTARLAKLIRTNTYDSTTGSITIDPIRAEAFEDNLAHYSQVFSEGNSMNKQISEKLV